jgi:RimJ/RimL family protein N-acetyltransferase
MTSLDHQIDVSAKRKLREIATSFETERLLIRAGTLADLDVSLKAAQESAAELRAWMPWAHPLPLRDSMEKYYSTCEEKWRTREMLDFQWVEKSSGELIGKGGFHHIDWMIPKFEIGYWLRTSHAGKGFCTEAVNGLVQFAKTELHAKRLEIRSQPANARSRAVAERCGFVLEGVLRSSLLGADGTLCDSCMYALVFD